MSWSRAQQTCIEAGGDLAGLETQAIHDNVASLATNVDSTAKWWLGLAGFLWSWSQGKCSNSQSVAPSGG